MRRVIFHPLSILILLGLIWGSGYSIARYAMLHTVPPLGYALWQTAGPACFLIFLCLLRRLAWFRFFLKYWHYFLVTGLLGIVVPNTNMYILAPHLPSNIVAILVNLSPLLIYPLALLIRQERFDAWRFFSVLLGMIGVLCVLLPRVHFPISGTFFWMLMGLLTPLNFSLCAIYISVARPKEGNALLWATGMLVMASILLTPLLFFSHEGYAMHLPLSITDWIILIKIILSSFGYLLLFQLLTMAGAVYYSLVDGAVILTGLLWGFLVFQERLTVLLCLAVVCIVVAIIIMNIRQQHTRVKT